MSLIFALTALAGTVPAARAQAAQGVVARGTATIFGPRGPESGAITISALGPRYCKVTIQLGTALHGRQYAVVLDGNHLRTTAPSGVAETVPLPITPGLGCALLANALGPDGTASATNDASGRVLNIRWTNPRASVTEAAALKYENYQTAGSLAYAADLTLTVGGATRAVIHIDSVAPAELAATDFVTTPLGLKIPATHGFPGGGQ